METNFAIIGLISMLAFGVTTMFIARSKGRNMIGWFFIGFFLSWLGTIIILFMGKTAAAAAKHNVKVAQGMMDILFEAAKGGTASEVRDTLAAGVDPCARNEYGVTPLHRAARFNSNPSVIVALIEGGADPSARDDNGKIPFDYAKEKNKALMGTDAYRMLNPEGSE